MTPAAVNQVAARFKVLGEPVRLHLLQKLEAGRLSVTELAKAVDSTQPNVSKHLKILQEAGLVARKQDGNTVYYSIADESVFAYAMLFVAALRKVMLSAV